MDREQKRIYQREWKANRRTAWIKSKGGRCANKKCRSTEGLQVDHIDPSTKLYEITDVWSRRAEIRNAELAKCQVLCEECHITKTTREAIANSLLAIKQTQSEVKNVSHTSR